MDSTATTNLKPRIQENKIVLVDDTVLVVIICAGVIRLLTWIISLLEKIAKEKTPAKDLQLHLRLARKQHCLGRKILE